MIITEEQKLRRDLETLEKHAGVVRRLREELDGTKRPTYVWIKLKYGYLLYEMEREGNKLRNEIAMEMLKTQARSMAREQNRRRRRNGKYDGAGADPAGADVEEGAGEVPADHGRGAQECQQ